MNKKIPPPQPKKHTELRPATPKVSRAELDVLLDRVRELAVSKPEKAGIILSDWLRQESNTKKKSG